MGKQYQYNLRSLLLATAYFALLLSIGLTIRWLIAMSQAPGIHFAAAHGDIASVRKYLEDGVSPTVSNGYRTTPLMSAAAHGHADIVALLVDAGAPVNEQSRMSRTPLMWAARNGHTEVVKMLLQRGASTVLLDFEGKSALDLAKLHHHAAAAVLLTESSDRKCNGPSCQKTRTTKENKGVKRIQKCQESIKDNRT